MLKRLTVAVAVIVTLLATAYLLIIGAGKPIGTDLSVVGQGRPTLVLAYENFSITGGDALNDLREVRGDFDARLEFVVADLGTPHGRAFADRYGLVDGQAVFLDQQGEALMVTSIASDAQILRSRLEAKLASVE